MFSLLTIKKASEEVANNAQVIELGMVSEITLGSFGDINETLRATRWSILGSGN